MSNPIVEVLPYLSRFNSLFYTFVNNMVEPRFANEVPTAGVGFAKKSNGKDCVDFIINEDFWNGLNVYDKTFVSIHEVLHVIFDHGYRGQEFLNTLDDDKKSHDLLNVAQDLTINPLILEEYMKDTPPSFFSIFDQMTLCFIDTVFKEHAYKIKTGQGFEYYYLKYIELFGLKEPIPKLTLDVHGFGGDGGDSKESKALPQNIQDFIDENNLEEVASGSEISNNDADQSNTGFGIGGPEGPEQDYVVENAKSLDELFKIVLDSKFKDKIIKEKKNNWYGFNRRTGVALASMSKDLILPVTQVKKTIKKKKHLIRVYLDVSGSCEGVSKKAVKLVTNLPKDKYEFELWPWASYVASKQATVDNGRVKFSGAGYGTSIEGVLNHYKQSKTKFDAVFVLTDGFYRTIRDNTMNDYSNWFFFYTPNHEKNHPREATGFEIPPAAIRN